MLYEYDYDKEIMINEILLDILYPKTWCLIESISGLLVKKNLTTLNKKRILFTSTLNLPEVYVLSILMFLKVYR